MKDTSSNAVALSCDHVSKSFDRRFVKGGYTTFKTQLVQMFQRSKYKEERERLRLDVLKDVSFTVRRGEALGVIGHNGAGKSTLLKLLTGIYKPSKGSVIRNGRISALLELGAGFHPEFSGRENIYMNGMILGLTRKQIKAKEEEIIAFSELGDFIDAPVRTYSSGMYMRLAFSVAVHVEPDILIIDEVLAVGDEHFQRKSKAKIDEFKSSKTAIVLVTHDLSTVQTWCTRALWLDQGRVAADGDPTMVIGEYRAKVASRENTAMLASAAEVVAPAAIAVEQSTQTRWGDKEIQITGVRLLDSKREPKRVFNIGEAVFVEVAYDAGARTFDQRVIGIAVRNASGDVLFGTNTKIDQVVVPTLQGQGTIMVRIDSMQTVMSDLRLDIAIETPDARPHDYWTDVVRFNVLPVGGRVGTTNLNLAWDFGNPREPRSRLAS